MLIGSISLLTSITSPITLSEVGQRQEALGPANEAANLYRDLTAKAPDAYRPALAMALNNLAVRLSEVGQHQEALTPAQEAAGLYRALAAKAPNAYRPDLAMALNNLGNRLSEVGRRQEALGPAQEAVGPVPRASRPRRPMPIGPISLLSSTT